MRNEYYFDFIHLGNIFRKSAVPDTPDVLKDFMHLLAKCGVDLPSYTTAYNAEDEDR